MSPPLSQSVPPNLAALLAEVENLSCQVIADAEQRLQPYQARYPEGFSPDARNLASYLALRSNDLRPLQERLVEAGLSSLGRGESHIQTNLNRVIGMLSRALGRDAPMDFPDEGPAHLERHSEVLFGKRNHSCYARIMVTLPSEAATQPELVAGLIANGMDCARINCAHDGATIWQAMITHIRAAEKKSGTRIKIFMDLGGHKIRTGPVQSGTAVLHLKVRHDSFGQVIAPAQVVLCRDQSCLASHSDTASLPRLPVSAELLECLQPGDRLMFIDTRKKQRRLQVLMALADGEWLAKTSRSAYIVPGTTLHLEGVDSRAAAGLDADYRVGEFAGKPADVRLFRGDQLLLRRGLQPGRPAVTTKASSHPAEISCSHPEIIDELQPGHTLWIDDGKLGCVVEQITEQGALLHVTHAGPKGMRIQADKGLNLPETVLPLPALTTKDLQDLDFICAHADVVGLSFVRQLSDIDELRRELATRGKPQLPIVIKIETAMAVKNLPDLLFGTLGQHPLGVMIARGDLAVELGSVRMAEIQEEILWICEAAHVPVIWATQVLETLAKDGVIDRPEITDAAMSVRAECVMMNKGPFITDAVAVLHDILIRMDAHQYKKVSRLRRLHW
ncbi:MAG TPA: pyruvate kinase [Gammaproteobacteria bacterium]|nr:pyruvate kinase [Gammaproteobacteria bacterium]